MDWEEVVFALEVARRVTPSAPREPGEVPGVLRRLDDAWLDELVRVDVERVEQEVAASSAVGVDRVVLERRVGLLRRRVRRLRRARRSLFFV